MAIFERKLHEMRLRPASRRPALRLKLPRKAGDHKDNYSNLHRFLSSTLYPHLLILPFPDSFCMRMRLPWRTAVLWLVAACIGAHAAIEADPSKVRQIPVSGLGCIICHSLMLRRYSCGHIVYLWSVLPPTPGQIRAPRNETEMSK